MKVSNQYSSEDLFNSLTFAPCGPSNDLAEWCAARGGFKLESPGLDMFSLHVREKEFPINLGMLPRHST